MSSNPPSMNSALQPASAAQRRRSGWGPFSAKRAGRRKRWRHCGRRLSSCRTTRRLTFCWVQSWSKKAIWRRRLANPDVRYQLGFTFRRMGQLPEAETELRHSLSLQPNNAEAYYVLGQTLEQMGKHQESATAFAEVERLHR